MNKMQTVMTARMMTQTLFKRLNNQEIVLFGNPVLHESLSSDSFLLGGLELHSENVITYCKLFIFDGSNIII